MERALSSENYDLRGGTESTCDTVAGRGTKHPNSTFHPPFNLLLVFSIGQTQGEEESKGAVHVPTGSPVGAQRTQGDEGRADLAGYMKSAQHKDFLLLKNPYDF